MFGQLHSTRWKIPLESLFSTLQIALRKQDTRLACAVASELYMSNYPGGLWNRLEIAAIEDFGLSCPLLAETIRRTRESWEKTYFNEIQFFAARKMLIQTIAYMSTLPTSRFVTCAAVTALYLCDKNTIQFTPIIQSYDKEVPIEVQKKVAILIEKFDYSMEFVDLLKAYTRALYISNVKDKETLVNLLYYTEQILLREIQKPVETISDIDFPKSNSQIKYSDQLWEILIIVCNEAQTPHINALKKLYQYYKRKEGSFSERLFLYHAILCVACKIDFINVTPLSKYDLADTKINTFFGESYYPLGLENLINTRFSSIEEFWSKGTIQTNENTAISNIFEKDARDINILAEKNYGPDGATMAGFRQRIRYSTKRKNIETDSDTMDIEETSLIKKRKTD